MRTVDTGRLRLLILQEFADIVADVTLPQPNAMRILLTATEQCYMISPTGSRA